MIYLGGYTYINRIQILAPSNGPTGSSSSKQSWGFVIRCELIEPSFLSSLLPNAKLSCSLIELPSTRIRKATRHNTPRNAIAIYTYRTTPTQRRLEMACRSTENSTGAGRYDPVCTTFIPMRH